MIAYVALVLALVALIFLGFPVGFAAGLASMAGAAVFFGDLFDPRVPQMIARLALDKIDSFLLLAIPFFVLAGRLMNTGGITTRLFDLVSLFVRPLKGGLAYANVLASVVFAGMSGSATADTAGLGSIEMRAMLDQCYDRRFSAGITGASSLIGPIIPPSIPLVAFAVQAEVSVAAMFYGGIVPGLLLALAFMTYVALVARRKGLPSGAAATLAEFGLGLRRGVLPCLTPVIIVGGIYAGVFTPTEAAAVAALYAILLSTLVYREFGWRTLLFEIRGAMIDSAVIMVIVAFTSAFGVVMIRARVPNALADALIGLTSDPTGLLLLLMVLWLVVGFFMSETPALLILTPILMPTIERFGIDPVHFGVVMILTLTAGLLTPPVGMVLYVLVRVTEVPFERLVLIMIPYVVMVFAVVVLLIFFPQLVLFLPGVLM
jgi:tripartite ATP-independent transporter DctM subunit